MNKLMLSIANFPLPLWRKFIPSLPDEIKSFTTVQRLWFVVSVVGFYISITVLLLDIYWEFIWHPGYSAGKNYVNYYLDSEKIDTLIIVLSFSFPIVLYHAVSLLSALFGFIFEKQLKK